MVEKPTSVSNKRSSAPQGERYDEHLLLRRRLGLGLRFLPAHN
jgi:hypothetical protein